jgi:hypothetical protein
MGTSCKRPTPIYGEGPRWEDVEVVLERLAQTGELLPSLLGAGSHVASYQRGRRLALDSQRGSQWIAVEDVRACWQTFERLRRIRRQDVLEPGRCSAFMVALFAQVPGVVEEIGGADRYLVLPT